MYFSEAQEIVNNRFFPRDEEEKELLNNFTEKVNNYLKQYMKETGKSKEEALKVVLKLFGLHK